MDLKMLVLVLVGVTGSVFTIMAGLIGYLGKRAIDQNTDQIKGLRDDMRRAFDREEKNGRGVVEVKGDIKRIDERCARNHATEG